MGSFWEKVSPELDLKNEDELFKKEAGRRKGPSSARGQSKPKRDASRGLAWAENAEVASLVRA